MSELEHHITVRSVQIWRGGFDADILNEDGSLREMAQDLQFQREKSLSFECSCGRRFQKWGTAAEHIHSEDIDDGPESGDTQ